MRSAALMLMLGLGCTNQSDGSLGASSTRGTIGESVSSGSSPRPSPAGGADALSPDAIVPHVADHDEVRWVKAATLMLHGTSACVDGRDSHAIIGTPGGDAGELVLALAAAEATLGTAFSEAEIEHIFDVYLEAFGHFYLHTDLETVERLHGSLRHAGIPGLPPPDAGSRWLRDPPEAIRAAVLERVVEPEFVGCGHLRLMLQRPTEYAVRPALVRTVLRAFMRRLWADPSLLDFRVLEGGHVESAVLTVELDHRVHAYSAIPLVSPRIADEEVFVNHPQVARFVREQNAAFLLEESAALAESGLQELSFLEQVEHLAKRQLDATLFHLARELPMFEVRFCGREFEVIRLSADAERDYSRL